MTLKELLAQAVVDSKLKEELIADFTGTCQKYNVSLTSEQEKNLSKVTKEDWDTIEKVMSNLILSSPCTLS